MKFLIPNYSPSDSFVDNVSFTLKAMGHDVINMGSISNKIINSPYYKLTTKLIQRTMPARHSIQEKWLLKKIRELSQIDVIFMVTQILSEEVLSIARKKGIKTVTWWGDTAANIKGKGLLIDEIDLIYIKDKYACSKLRSLGKNSFYMHEAMNPQWHKRLSKQQNDNLILAGSFYDYRHYLTRKLIKDKIEVELYGGNLPIWADTEIKERHTLKFIVKEEKSQIFGAGLAVLNSTAMSEFDSINCRAFEIAGIGGLQIMEYRPALEECFEIDKEILVYREYEELLELINRAKRHPKEMEKIRQNGLKRALAEHTYAHRLQRIISDIHQL